MGIQFTSTDAAKELGIGGSSLSKYAITLESHGYRFTRGAKNARIFSEKDLDVLRGMIEEIGMNGLTIDDAAATVVKGSSTDVEPAVEDFRMGKLLEQMDQLTKQQAEVKKQNEILAKEVQRLTDKIDERERDQQLLQRLHDKKEKNRRKGIAILNPLAAFTGKR